jgi:ATP-dependent protease ClpP protease subunit
MMLLLLFLFSVWTANIYAHHPIYLNVSNVITVKDAIDDETATNFLHKLNMLKNKNGIYVYLDTPGGSVESGNKILMEIQKYNLSCIADRAYSMGFVILQGCANRYITHYGRLMQHQISYAIKNEKGKIDSYSKFIDQVETELVGLQADRIQIPHDEFRLKTMNEWWMVGKYAIDNNCADQIVDVFCDTKLTNTNITEEYGPIEFVYSACPLIPGPVEVVPKK